MNIEHTKPVTLFEADSSSTGLGDAFSLVCPPGAFESNPDCAGAAAGALAGAC